LAVASEVDGFTAVTLGGGSGEEID
jgi:hypothetical protein